MADIFRKSLIKKICSVACVMAVLFCASACGRVQMEFDIVNDIYNLNSGAFEPRDRLVWSFGGEGKNQLFEMEEQGENNFYCLYSGQVNKTTPYDISTFEECIYNIEDLNWYADVGNVLRSSVYFSEYEGTTLGKGFNKALFCPIIGFKAPQDGVYDLTVNNISLGNTNLKDADVDGVKLMIYSNRQEVYSEEVKRGFESLKFSLKVNLKKDQLAYLIIDPLKNGKGDTVQDVYLTVSLDTSYTQMYVDHDVAFGFGDVYDVGSYVQQGSNGWYYLYSDKNEYGVYEPDSFKKCDNLDIETYVNSSGKREDQYYWLGSGGVRIGHIKSTISAGENTAAVVALDIPRKGSYAFDIYFDAEAIGNFSVYCGDRRVRVPSFEEGKDGYMSFEAIMQEDEMFYFILSKGTCEPKIAIRQTVGISGLEENDSE